MTISKTFQQMELFPPSSSQAGIPVNHFHKPGSEEARKMTATSGQKCLESFENVGPLGYLRKMLVDTLNWGSKRCSLTWKVKDTIPRFSILELWPRTLPIEECDSGLWLTPSTVQIEPTEGRREKRTAYRLSIGRKDYPGCLAEQVATPKMWPTPRAKEPGRTTEGYGRGLAELVEGKEQVKMWPTPRAQDSKHGAATEWELNTDHAGTKDSLRVHVAKQKMWPTPNARDYKDSGENVNWENVAKKGKLAGAVMWPTPTANEDACGKPTGKMQKMLGNHPDVRNTGKGSLHPDWVEHYLMGYPYGWTNLTSQELESESRTEPKD